MSLAKVGLAQPWLGSRSRVYYQIDMRLRYRAGDLGVRHVFAWDIPMIPMVIRRRVVTIHGAIDFGDFGGSYHLKGLWTGIFWKGNLDSVGN